LGAYQQRGETWGKKKKGLGEEGGSGGCSKKGLVRNQFGAILTPRSLQYDKEGAGEKSQTIGLVQDQTGKRKKSWGAVLISAPGPGHEIRRIKKEGSGGV